MKLRTRTDIEVFASKIWIAGIELPPNVRIVVDMPKEDFEEIVPSHMHGYEEIEYNTNADIKVHLKNKSWI